MTLTRPDGSESIELLAITDQERVSIDEHFEPFLDKLADVWGSRSAACRMLMARLAAEHDADASSVAPGKGREDVQYG